MIRMCTFAEEKQWHCLCVEDNIVLQRMLKLWFGKLNIGVTQVFDGKEATEQCKKRQFSLIFMDIAMPIMDGLEATSIIRYRKFSITNIL